MLKIRLIQDIKRQLLLNKQIVRNFPKSVSFKFDALYQETVTQIKTIEISSECILFDSVESYNVTRELSDSDYWSEEAKEEINKFWFFGANGQGDFWLFDDENKVYFYDHEYEEICFKNFTDLGLNFEKWLQYSCLNKQLDEVYEKEGEISEEIKNDYKEKLKELSGLLSKKYPFEI